MDHYVGIDSARLGTSGPDRTTGVRLESMSVLAVLEPVSLIREETSLVLLQRILASGSQSKVTT